MIPLIIFILCFTALFHSYILFPVLLKFLKGKQHRISGNHQPSLSILMAAYNEEAVIKQKIESVLNSNYPDEKLELIIGSDGSTDRTDEIIQSFSSAKVEVRLIPFSGRNGKPNIINALLKEAKHDILISTDANVIFDKNTIKDLVKHFEDETIGLVDSNMCHFDIKVDGIAQQESNYVQREVLIKHQEGAIWGAMIGPAGGCFAIRKNLMPIVPKNYTVDDFYICMKVLEKGYKAINDLDAKVYEDVSNETSEEIRRKIRIATGNFQNLMTFKHLWMNPFSKIGFPFFSHKVLRWFGPFFLIGMLWSNLHLIGIDSLYIDKWHNFFLTTLIFQLFLAFTPLFDLILKKIGIHAVFLRYAAHFYNMNIALLIGFFKYCKGIQSNVWEPTKRKQ